MNGEGVSETTQKTAPSENRASALDFGKAAPSANYSEQVVLARLMTNEDSYDIVANGLTESDFYRAEHRLIYSAIFSLGEQNDARDAYAVAQRLQLGGDLPKAGGMEYLSDLCTETSDIVDLEYHIDCIRHLSLRRQLMACAEKIVRMASASANEPIEQLLDRADSELFALTTHSQSRHKNIERLGDMLEGSLLKLRERFESGNALSGLATGFIDLDQLTDGLQNSDMVIVAARPSMGKTAVTLCIANHVAVQLRLPVLFFSLEMPKEQISNRLLSLNGRVSQSSIRSGRLDKEEWDRIMQAYGRLEDCPFYVDDTPGLTSSELRTRVRRFVREHPDTALVAVDYLQLMSAPPRRNDDNRAIVLGEITRSLKILAREIGLPIIVLSQLSRATEMRSDKRPMMSDLRESGAIEQDADLILFIHRPGAYNPEANNHGETDIIVGKHRNGSTRPFKLRFEGEFARFENHARDDNDGPTYI